LNTKPSFEIGSFFNSAYFRKINDEGGINGRKITLISYDDSYRPPEAVEQVRKPCE
jgi:branched-chain amino acid transport system substrate-binding protein